MGRGCLKRQHTWNAVTITDIESRPVKVRGKQEFHSIHISRHQKRQSKQQRANPGSRNKWADQWEESESPWQDKEIKIRWQVVGRSWVGSPFGEVRSNWYWQNYYWRSLCYTDFQAPSQDVLFLSPPNKHQTVWRWTTAYCCQQKGSSCLIKSVLFQPT